MPADLAQQRGCHATSPVGHGLTGCKYRPEAVDIDSAPESDRALATETARALLIAAGYGLLLVLAGRVIR